ncbi:MAG: M20/M25/M40 family metallo-hydrolase [Candidatus Eremiobacteraeota bacterium]|nr:M20/M25/M40 family metallo-hydrolase [Candidatus Eremiobacteraeota bacterium]
MINRERMVDLVLELVRIDSHPREEKAVADRLLPALRQAGADVRIDDAGHKVGGDVGNLIARVPGNKPGAMPLLLSAHMDTVQPGQGVKPIREPDRIRSDGTTILGGDDKSGLAVIVEVLRVLSERALAHGDIEVAFTICEEVGLLGAKHLSADAASARCGIVLDSPHASTLVTWAPSADHFQFIVHGLEAHAGVCPEQGISAVRVAAEAIAAMPLGRIDDQTTSNVVIVEGGQATNVVPNRCTVRGEARSLIADRLDRQTAAIRRCFQDAAAAATATVNGQARRAWVEETIERQYEGMKVPDDAPIVRRVIEAARSVNHTVRTESIGGGSDANVFNRRGIQTVNLGTGMRAIHTVNEWIDLKDFYACADTVLACCTM